MDKNKVYVFLDHGHCLSTPGKKSPDKSLKEYEYNRVIVKGIEEELDKLRIKHWNDHPELDFVIKDKGTCKNLDSRDLVLRATRVNTKYVEVKKQGCKAFLISCHVNAAGSEGKWLNATGWACYTTVGQNNSDKLADCLYDAAEEVLKPYNKKFRTGDVIEFDIQHWGITYITGKNGQGKTTILRAFRGIKDSLREVNRFTFDGMIPQELEIDKLDTKAGFDIEGFDYDEVFSLDSVVDDPLSFQNSASAGGFIGGGGMQMMRMSKGEKALIMFHQFVKKIDEYLKKKYPDEKELYSKKILIMVDEVDEGFDARLQMNFNTILWRKFNLSFGADVLLVTHNSLCMMSPSLGDVSVYDIETMSQTTPKEYFERKTGYSIELTKLEKDESDRQV